MYERHAFLILGLLITIPIVAIVGGIVAGIVKTLSRQRLLELAQKERIAAIERGIPPDKLPPVELPGGRNGSLTFEQRSLRRSQLLLIWGIITTAFGFAAAIGLSSQDEDSVAFGFLFVFIGIALMVGSRVGRPSKEEVAKSVERKKSEPQA
jgi:hypothetical protein